MTSGYLAFTSRNCSSSGVYADLVLEFKDFTLSVSFLSRTALILPIDFTGRRETHANFVTLKPSQETLLFISISSISSSLRPEFWALLLLLSGSNVKFSLWLLEWDTNPNPLSLDDWSFKFESILKQLNLDIVEELNVSLFVNVKWSSPWQPSCMDWSRWSLCFFEFCALHSSFSSSWDDPLAVLWMQSIKIKCNSYQSIKFSLHWSFGPLN